MSKVEKKRRRTDSKQEVQFDDSEQPPQPNLERRAAHYARADPKSFPSSTPTGAHCVNLNGRDGQKESWPGPFATAHAMIQQREDAKKAREEAILAASNGTSTAVINVADMDEYDKYLNSLKWEPSTKGRNGAKRSVISTLSDICVKTLVSHFHEIDDSIFSMLSTEICSKFAVELCRQRMFSCEVALQLAVPGSERIFYPECSVLSDDALVAAMEKVSQGKEEPVFNEGTQAISACVSSLRILQLRNCGHGFTDQVAETVSEKHGRGLEMLELTGCYRLNEAALCLLLQKCRENLKSLDLSCNSRLGVNSASVVASMNCLTYLKLDNATPFTNIMLSPLLDSDALGSLEHLSLAGLIDVDDAGLGPVIKKFGPKLRSLCIGGCVQLTDESIVTIRESCRVLDALDIGRLGQITTAALLGLFIEGPVQQGGVIVEIPILFDTGIEADDVEKPSLPHEMSRSASEGATGSDSMIGRLTTINLSGLPSAVTDDVIIQLCQLSGSLQSVDIGGCASLTSRAISALQLHCRDSLETLDVSFVRNFSEDTLGALVDQAPQFKNLAVWGCTQLTKRFFDGHRNDYLNIDGRMEA